MDHRVLFKTIFVILAVAALWMGWAYYQKIDEVTGVAEKTQQTLEKTNETVDKVEEKLNTLKDKWKEIIPK